MEQILTGNHRLLRNLNSNVILNRIRTQAPAIGTNFAFINNAKPSGMQNILKSLEDTKSILKNKTAYGPFWGIQAPVIVKIVKILACNIDINSQLPGNEKRKILQSAIKLLFRQRIFILPIQYP